ncbi:thioesterase domain-containing protein [Streptomyces sp. HF10]|uniref:thioesterase domain-containing protein n=1 Tax=Streptomyces sp. HF10 TaxID=2692233 RepID=UPI001317FDE2|nr:alpha/beta fold hydrolase [Streptomyces sp. HF10]QHC31817.1 alpha/beta fold hydrolase [Streptomyces sp. HF10]
MSQDRTPPTGSAARETSYVRLLPGSHTPTYAFVHPVGGSVSGYVDVVAALPAGTECVGVRARGLSPQGEPHHDIPTMATDYLDELLAYHEPEQLVLAGYSFGGLVAFEMARRLRERGRTPAGTVLLGTYVPRHDVPRAERVATFARLVSVIYRVPLERLRLDGLDDAEMVDRAAEVAGRCDTLPAAYRQADLRRLFQVLALNLRMAQEYDVPPYDGLVHLVRPERPDPRDTLHAWRSRCPSGVVTHDIGGEHNELMSADRGVRIAQALAALWPA